MEPTKRHPSTAAPARGVAALLALAGCGDDAPRPWEVTPGDRAGPRLHVAAPPRPEAPASAAPSASPPAAAATPRPPPRRRRPGAPPACDEGLGPSGEPRRDVVRLGLSCGPGEGFTRDRDGIEGAIAEGGAAVDVEVPLAAGRCYRVVAAAETTIADLDVELRSERDVPLATDDDEAPLVVVHRDGAPCAASAGVARLVVRAGAGRGRFAAEVWSRPARADDADPAAAPGPSAD